MKKTILFALLIFLIPSLCLAGSVQDKLKAVLSAGGAAACGEIQKNETQDSLATFGDAAGTQYGSTSFTAAATTTIKTIYLYLKDVGSPTGLAVAICTNNAGSPSTTCTAADATITGTSGTLAWLKTNIAAGYAITSGTLYHIRVYQATDASNYYVWGYDGAGTGTVKKSADGSSWSSVDATAQADFKLSSCVE